MNQSHLIRELTALKSLIENNTIGIVLGDRLNLDIAAAGLALFLSLKELGRNVQIVSKREPYVEISNLVGIDKIEKGFRGTSNRVVVSLPYSRGEIGKVSYKEEEGRINFYLTAADGRSITPYATNDINLIWEGSAPDVVIALGVSSPAQLSEFVDSAAGSLKIVNINTQGDEFGDVAIVDQTLSSSSEIVSRILKELRLPINVDIAQNLLDGVLFATKNFTKKNASPLAFEATGLLMQLGAKRKDNRNTGKESLFSQPQKTRDKKLERPRQRQDFHKRTKTFEEPRTDNNTNQNVVEKINERENMDQQRDKNNVPNDWLMPKVFKGSQDINDLK